MKNLFPSSVEDWGVPAFRGGWGGALQRARLPSGPSIEACWDGRISSGAEKQTLPSSPATLQLTPGAPPGGRDAALTVHAAHRGGVTCWGKKLPLQAHCVCSRRLPRRGHAGGLPEQPRAGGTARAVPWRCRSWGVRLAVCCLPYISLNLLTQHGKSSTWSLWTA